MKKTPIVICILLLFAGIVIIAFILKKHPLSAPQAIPTPAPSFSVSTQKTIIYSSSVSYPNDLIWKHYTNKDFGISFLYPSALYSPAPTKDFPFPINPKVFTDDLKTIPKIALILPNDEYAPNGNERGMRIEKYVHTTMENWIENNANGKGSVFPVTAFTIIKTTFHSYPAYYFQRPADFVQQSPNDSFLVQVGKNMYFVNIDAPFASGTGEQAYNDAFNKKTKPIIDAMLASIKFL